MNQMRALALCVGLGSMAVLLALMLVFAHRAGASLLWTTMEWVFCTQFALVARGQDGLGLRLVFAASTDA